EKLVVIAPSAGRLDLEFGQNQTVGPLVVTRALDGRISSVTGSVLNVGTGSIVAGQIGTTILSYQGAANVAQEWISDTQHELVLLPGDAYYVQDQTVNEQLIVSAIWRERYLEEGERK